MPVPRQGRIPGTGGDTRRRILDAAEELIAARGFDATSTAAIATSAGVPKGLIFYYFPTKESILTTLIAERLPTDPIGDIDGLAVTGEPEVALVNLDAALDLTGRRTIREIVWREADTHPLVREQLRALRTYLHDVTVEVLRLSSPLTAPARVLDSCATAWVAAMFSATHLDRFRERDERADDLRAVARVVTAGLGALSHP
ncbi:TetR/AcrR family transcriptional regulator [Rhodococcus sp. NPDC058505]|uniref:TetR/AcrR family transcriptional regulator n=1 Tax=Rhodococcus sp. NPDC058505 TaxID=3346531 RepID=UPI0036667545